MGGRHDVTLPFEKKENPIGSFLIPGLLFRPFERSISSSIHPSRPPASPGIVCGWTKILIIAQILRV
ncbi:hypothetical protein CBS115989_1572 [Aspergillus niger]|nr:hypothetical protein CBS115989_1572 [Aspergillus niger]KAI2846266.1 hypothetical protein CBS11350_3806 [Aspergillus niger]KAI2855765.1 hypothetical protein CBS11232_4234 [Aspergillus niger]KAI2880440.1 hypothetical protein CBS115988_1529 [Aspergillus niger]